MFSILNARPVVHRQSKPLLVQRTGLKSPPCSSWTSRRRNRANAVPHELVALNEVVSNKSWTLVSHAVVNFSVIYFSFFDYFSLNFFFLAYTILQEKKYIKLLLILPFTILFFFGV